MRFDDVLYIILLYMMSRNGSIYGNGYVYLSEVEIYPNDMNIGTYEVKGFSGSLVPSYQRVSY